MAKIWAKDMNHLMFWRGLVFEVPAQAIFRLCNRLFSPSMWDLRRTHFKWICLTRLRKEEVMWLECFLTVAVSDVTREWVQGLLTSAALGYLLQTARTAADTHKFLIGCTTTNPGIQTASQRRVLPKSVTSSQCHSLYGWLWLSASHGRLYNCQRASSLIGDIID